jgi:predicted ATPase
MNSLGRLLRDGRTAREWTEALIALATEHELLLWLGMATMLRGAALVEEACLLGRQEEVEKGIVQLCQGVAAYRSTGAGLDVSPCLVLLAKGYVEIGQPQEGLNVLAEALTIVNNGRERYYEAELYRLKGELTFQQSKVQGSKFKTPTTHHPTPSTQAESCFLKAIDIARQQSAKLLELRAVMSLCRLWQQDGKKNEARQLLMDTHNWFTEGFDTADLKDAKTLLDELS